jgi:GNAT superfamily N-acetyltransferase
MSNPSGASPRDYTIRPIHPDDMEVLANLVRELAVYEDLEEYAKGTPDDFRRHLFGPRPAAEAVIVEVAGEAVGFALWFGTFSTYRGRPGIYLEDLFVRPEHRGRGIGKAILAMLARLAVERGCGKMHWSAVRWNEPAIGFYRALGAQPVDEWIGFRLDGEALHRLAARGREFESRPSDREDAER